MFLRPSCNTHRVDAWSSPIEGSARRRFFAVLHLGGIRSPQDAVRAAIVAEHKAERCKACESFSVEPRAPDLAGVGASRRLLCGPRVRLPGLRHCARRSRWRAIRILGWKAAPLQRPLVGPCRGHRRSRAHLNSAPDFKLGNYPPVDTLCNHCHCADFPIGT